MMTYVINTGVSGINLQTLTVQSATWSANAYTTNRIGKWVVELPKAHAQISSDGMTVGSQQLANAT